MNRKWGSLLGNAVANLESKLDTILAEDGNTKKPLPGQKVGASDRARSTSRVRKEQATRTSLDSQRSTNQRTSIDSTRTTITSTIPEVQVHEPENVDGEISIDLAEADTLGAEPLEITTQLQTDDQAVPNPRLSLDDNDPSSTIVPSENLHAELAQLRGDNEAQEVQRQEEVHNYLERIDALQAKLSYLASEAASHARASAEAAPAESLEKKLAAKDEQIALLLEEGQKLSKAEVTQSTTLRKFRAKIADDGRAIADLRRKLTAADKSSAEKAETLARLETGVKEAGGKLVRLARAERELEELKKVRDTRDAQIESLQEQLDSAQSKAKTDEREATAKALEAERKVAQSLKDDLVSVKLEKQLAEDKKQAELKAASDEKDRQRERHAEVEATLRNEISILESRLEVLRGRNEEASSAASGDSQAKLLRQIELLQSQYSQASENFQGIESSLQARLAAVERERDEANKQEQEIRKKSRETNSTLRRLQDELDDTARQCSILEADLAEKQAAASRLQSRATEFERSLQDAKAQHEREKSTWESSLQARIEEEKLKQEAAAPPSRVESPTYFMKRPQQALEIPNSLASRRGLSRNASLDFGLPSQNRRSSVLPMRTPDLQPNGFESGRSTPPILNMPSTPSIREHPEEDPFDMVSSPHQTVHDMISDSTTAAGPSVQLVERMSAAVRRLESEKAASKDEMARVVAQRNEARKELVAMMKEVEVKRNLDAKAAKLEKECSEVGERYRTTLEMLGEKSEEVEELRADVADLKKIYRELVERTVT